MNIVLWFKFKLLSYNVLPLKDVYKKRLSLETLMTTWVFIKCQYLL